MSAAIRVLRQLLTSRAAAPIFRPLMRTRASIFMLHRFAMPDLGVEGHDPAGVRGALEMLRREGYDFVALDALFDDLLHGRSRKRPAIAFTIDDGYRDHALVGAPIFSAFDCPVTTFATSGFLDRQLWFWWDRIEYVFDGAKSRRLATRLGDQALTYEWTDVPGRLAAQADFTARCKEVPDAVKLAGIEALAAAADVELPVAAPEKYAPMTWDELRTAERGGMSFGPHTVTHPVLARATDEQTRFELIESWRRLREEAARPVPVFCYPNGRPVDFGEREIATLRELGFIGAVTGTHGYAERLDVARKGSEPDPFRVMRWAYTEDRVEMRTYVSGMERAKDVLRGR